MTLFESVGGQSNVGTKLNTTAGWIDKGNGTDDVGFSALPGGTINAYGSQNKNIAAWFWTITESESVANEAVLMAIGLLKRYEAAYLSPSYDGDEKSQALSVRCLKDK